MARIMLVGAYERDNFGDLLLLLVTERYVAAAEVVAAAPFAADMRPLLDRRIPACGPLLRAEPFDVIWTVGGQVGSISTERAYRLAAPGAELARFERARPLIRRRIMRRATGGRAPLSPYIPEDSNAALTIVNSAGVSGVRWEPRPRRAELLDLLRNRSLIAVRDAASSRYLTSEGIAHALVPDAVHAVSRLWPGERDRESDYAIVQASDSALRALDPERFGSALARSANLAGLRLRILLAGTAAGHDSVAGAQRLAAAVRQASPCRDVALLDARRPRELTDAIRGARVVIGSSLHVRVVAAAYGVARVSLPRPKVARYARTWDADMPFDVAPERLDRAVGRAVSEAERPAAQAHAAGLTRLAHEHLTQLADRALAPRPRTGAPTAWLPAVRERRATISGWS